MLTTVSIYGKSQILVVSNKLSISPAYEYADGTKTERRRKDKKGNPLFRLKGALPLIDGEVLPDGTIFLTSDALPDVSVGQVLEFEGKARIRAAKGFGLTATLEGRLKNPETRPEFSLPEDIQGGASNAA